MRILYTLTIFLSSALLFLVQPMVARIILPAYGGTASVWTTSELFFQAVLLLGYGYAHLSTKRFGPRKQSWYHLPLMGVALLTLPFATHVVGATDESSPIPRLLMQLSVMVGLAFFAISAGAPLIQRWFADTRDPHAKDPYFLYSASNLGSMVALLAYPALFEPRFTLGEQAKIWAGGFGVLIVMMLACAVVLKRSPKPEEDTFAEAEQVEVAQAVPAVTSGQRWRWIALAAVPSSLLLGVTTYVTTNITPIPLLWVVPLALYLLTFILAFAKRPLLSARVLGRLTPLLLTPLMVAVIMEAFIPALAAAHLVAFFFAAWMCHARLSESRPHAKHLTEFYFCLSVGGVIGGAFNAILAPVAFNSLLEYPLALVAAGLMVPAYRPGSPRNRFDGIFPALVVLLSIAMVLGTRFAGMAPTPLRTGLVVGVPAALCFLAVDRPLRYSLSLLGMLIVSQFFAVSSSLRVVARERSFFGVHRVLFSGGNRFHELTHGNTVHGMQDTLHPETPLTYYYPTGPVGAIFKGYSGANEKKNVALVGLGVGSIAAYGVPGQTMTYYEIDPLVRDIAENPKYFTFLRDSKAKVNVVIGDARLRLAQAPDHSYDLIVLDAFSSDAIPVHLLTKEAAEMYRQKLKPGGVLAYHVSNRYLDLARVLAALGKSLHMFVYDGLDGTTNDEEAAGKRQSEWILMADKESAFDPLASAKMFYPIEVDPIKRPWTDDFSNVLSVLKSED